MHLPFGVPPAFIRHEVPPYDNGDSLEANFKVFFEWASDLRRPEEVLIAVSERAGFKQRRHPLGFVAVELSPAKDTEDLLDHRTGLARANIYPKGLIIEPDIHCHGFDFFAGVVHGQLENTDHQLDFSRETAGEDTYRSFVSVVNEFGENEVSLLQERSTITVTSSTTHTLGQGDTYSMRAQVDFHSVAGDGLVTILCKTPADHLKQSSESIFLRKHSSAAPVRSY